MKRRGPGYLIVKGKKLEKKLNSEGKTVKDFANRMFIEMSEAYRILSGERAGVDIARKFITRYGADFAHLYIDWAAMGMSDPYPTIKKRNIKTRHYDRRNTA